MLLSVIIPVYHVEQTLDRCIQSVLSQEVSDMEMILVDDGSPDSCPTKCDEWAKKSSQIKVIHKKNGGLSDARNAGIAVATGDYLTFVDSDDYLLSDTYPSLIRWISANQEVDMLEYPIHHEDQERQKFIPEERVFGSPMDYWFTTRAWNHSYAWNKIYRRSLFEKNKYAAGRKFEDLLILPLLLKGCQKVATTRHGGYVYAENPQSISKQVTLDSLRQLLWAEVHAAWVTCTMPWSRNGADLYYQMGCRCYDIIRLLLGAKL